MKAIGNTPKETHAHPKHYFTYACLGLIPGAIWPRYTVYFKNKKAKLYEKEDAENAEKAAKAAKEWKRF